MDTVWSRDVNVVLEHSSIHHRERSHPEASSHLQDRAEVDFIIAKQWVYHNLFARQLPLTRVFSGGDMKLTVK